MLPDRGWNTRGTLDFEVRLQKFNINFTPFEGAQTNKQNQLKLSYRKAIQFHEADGTSTTGLDATKVLPKTAEFPKLPAGCRTDPLSVDNEGSSMSAMAPSGSATNTVLRLPIHGQRRAHRCDPAAGSLHPRSDSIRTANRWTTSPPTARRSASPTIRALAQPGIQAAKTIKAWKGSR